MPRQEAILEQKAARLWCRLASLSYQVAISRIPPSNGLRRHAQAPTKSPESSEKSEKSRQISYLEGDARGHKKKNKGEEEENLEPVGREPDVPDLREEHF